MRNGLEINVYGDIHFYEGSGHIEIQVQELRLVNSEGDARPAIELLRSEGLFPPQKRAAPSQIRRIGIVTSRSSRAIGDFESAYRSAGSRSVLAPYDWQFVFLEGERAAQSIVDAIIELDSSPECAVIAIIRGGGRSEDLATFDHIEIARAIIRCDTYVVTGIGHHRDSTLADRVADFSADTPTATAHYLAQLCMENEASAPQLLIADSLDDRQDLKPRDSLKRRFLMLCALAIVILLAVALIALFVPEFR